MRKFKKVKEVAIGEIDTRKEIFQGRQEDFSKATYDKIIREGFDKSLEPIEVWYDEDVEKYIVISGHSRFAAAQELYNRGQEDLATLPIKVFNGTLEEAIDYALESNFQGTAEGLISEIKLFKRKISPETPACNRECLLGLFKEGSKIAKLQDLQHLNLKGRFLEELNKPSFGQFVNIENYARWTGKLRDTFPQISDKHEDEIFEAIYVKNIFNDKLPKKDDFFTLIEKKVNRFDFNPSEPLNLVNVRNKTVYELNADEQIKEIEAKIKQLESRNERLDTVIVNFENQGRKDKVQEFTEEYTGNAARIRKLKADIGKIKIQAQESNRGASDLFAAPKPSVKKQPSTQSKKEKLEKRIQVFTILAKRATGEKKGQLEKRIQAFKILLEQA